MTPSAAQRSPLDFSPPDPNENGSCDEAERQCLGFPDLFLRKSRELNEAQRTLTEVLDHSEQRMRFVIRNLLDSVENCRSMLDAHTARPGDGPAETNAAEVPAFAEMPADGGSTDTGDAPGTTADGAAADGPAADAPAATQIVPSVGADGNGAAGADADHPLALGLASAVRTLEYLLGELGVRRVDLQGTTYVSVEVDGRPIDDPFEVVSTTQTGKASGRTVTKVLRNLWVDEDGRVVQKGSVVC